MNTREDPSPFRERREPETESRAHDEVARHHRAQRRLANQCERLGAARLGWQIEALDPVREREPFAVCVVDDARFAEERGANVPSSPPLSSATTPSPVCAG